MGRSIQLLDCTLRDGGFALEDAEKNGQESIRFEKLAIDHMIGHLENSGIDIVELGAIEISKEDKKGFAIYQNMESISRKIPKERKDSQMYVALYRGPDTPLSDIPDHNPSLCDGARVILRYSELQKSLDFCHGLSEKGYKVFVQPMLTMRYSEDELKRIVDAANAMNAYALYFVDSYGYMQAHDIRRFFQYYDANLEKDIRIGFHAHNNINLAFSNVISFLNQESERDLVVDSCAIGMGQGAGNLQTELIVPYLNENYGKQYNYPPVLEICEIIESYMTQNIWGYSVIRLLPAIHKTAYKYAVRLRQFYGLSYAEIDDILCKMPKEFRQRYTAEDTKKVLEILGIPCAKKAL